MKNINQVIPIEVHGITLMIKREDLIHPFVSGNKFRKLKYNLIQARHEGHKQLLTFGGAFSNHIVAVAAAGKEYGFRTIGIIRGDEFAFSPEKNPTLCFAIACGMQLEFVSREDYRKKTELSFLGSLEEKFGVFYLLPEGGTNALAVKGCEEILTETDSEYDFICCPVGTGGTISGLINSIKPHQKILGFPALKGDFLKEEICRFATNERWELISDYHFGGYGKVTDALVVFINAFFLNTGIPLDPLYTGKMVFGVIDLIERNYFAEGARILMIHTGGLQGIAGMNIKLKKKKSQTLLTHA